MPVTPCWYFLGKQSNKTKKERKKREGEGGGRRKRKKKTFLEFEGGLSVSTCSWNNNHEWTEDEIKQRVRDDIKISVIPEHITIALLETIPDTNNHNKTAAEITYLLFYTTHTPANISYLLVSCQK